MAKVDLDYQTDPNADERLNPVNNPANKLSGLENNAFNSEGFSTDNSNDGDPAGNNYDGGSTAQDVINDKEKSSWTTDIHQDSERNTGQQKLQVKNLKKRAAAYLISAIVVAVGGGIALIAPSMLLSSILGTVKEHDSAAITEEYVSGKLLVKRLSNNTTKGCDGVVKITCKYSKPSNKLIKNLSEAGIKAVDASGNVIDKQGWALGKTRPEKYILSDGTELLAKDFASEMKKNPKVRSAFRKAYNPRWVVWSDNLAKKFLSDLGIKKTLPADIDNAKDSDSIKKSIDTEVKGEVLDENSTKKAINDEVEDFAKKNKKGLRKILGDSLSPEKIPLTIARTICITSSLPGAALKVVRGYQFLMLAKYAMIFLTAGDSMRSGKISPEVLAGIGEILTTVVAGKSAMDSFGMRYITTGDINPGRTSTYKQFVPSLNPALSGIIQARNDPTIKGACELANSTAAEVTSEALGALKASNPVGWGSIILGGALGFAAEAGMLDPLIDFVFGEAAKALLSVLPIQDMLQAMFGDQLAGIVGEVAGDAFAIGGLSLLAKLANKRGGAALTKPQKVAFEKNIATSVRLAWAEEDRATLNPLDASSRHTLIGSIAAQLTPYYSRLSNVAGYLSLARGIMNLSASLLSGSPVKAKAYFDEKELSTCQDPLITSTNTAANPMCVVYYGIPDNLPDIDYAVTALNDMGELEISDDGEDVKIKPGGELEEWSQGCMDDDTANLANCQISDDDEKGRLFVTYLLYESSAQSQDQEVEKGISSPASGDFPPAVGATVVPLAEEDISKVYMSAGYGAYPSSGNPHWGIDLATKGGIDDTVPFVSSCDGVVEKIDIKSAFANINAEGKSGSTNYVWIKCDNGIYMGYAHFYARSLLPHVTTGARITAGTPIAPIGSQGNSSGPHLHFQINPNSTSGYSASATINPVTYLCQNGVSWPSVWKIPPRHLGGAAC